MSPQINSKCPFEAKMVNSVVHFVFVLILSDTAVLGAIPNTNSSVSASIQALYYNGNSSSTTTEGHTQSNKVIPQKQANLPVVYFQPTSIFSSINSTTTPSVAIKSNVSVIDFRKEKLDMNSSVEYDDNSSRDQSNSNEMNSSRLSDRNSKEEEPVLWLANKQNSHQQSVQWSPIVPSMAKAVLPIATLRKRKRKKTKPIMLIAQSVQEEKGDKGEQQEPVSRWYRPKEPQATKYLVVASDGSKVPIIMQSSTTSLQDSGGEEVKVTAAEVPIGGATGEEEDSTGKGDRLMDYYSDRLTTGPFDGNNEPVVNSFVKYSVPPPPPPAQLAGMPIMANVYWRKIIYPASMVPMSKDQNSASASSPSEATLYKQAEGQKQKGHKYIVYYVKKDKSGLDSSAGQGMRLVASSNDQQQQLAQSIIRQIEQMEEANKATVGDGRAGMDGQRVNGSPLITDQDMGNSQIRYDVLNKQMLGLTHDRHPSKHSSKSANRQHRVSHQNIYPQVVKDEEVIVLRRKTPRQRIASRVYRPKQYGSSGKHHHKVVFPPVPLPPSRIVFRDSGREKIFRDRQPHPSYLKLVKI